MLVVCNLISDDIFYVINI